MTGLLGADLGTTLLDDSTARAVLRIVQCGRSAPLLARDGIDRRPLLLEHQRQADPMVPRARAEGPCRAAADARPARLARLALPLRRRLREPAGLCLLLCPRGRRALSRQGRLLDLRRPAQHRRGVVALRAEASAAGRPHRRAGPLTRPGHAGAGLVRSALGGVHAAARVRLPAVALRRHPRPSGLGLGRFDVGDQRRLLARRDASAAPPGVQSPVGRLEPAGAAAVAIGLRARAGMTKTRWPSTRRPCRRTVGPRRPSRRGSPGSCRSCLAKPMVQGVIWNQLRDSDPHDFPHGGLFDDRRHAELAPPHAGRHPPDVLDLTLRPRDISLKGSSCLLRRARGGHVPKEVENRCSAPHSIFWDLPDSSLRHRPALRWEGE